MRRPSSTPSISPSFDRGDEGSQFGEFRRGWATLLAAAVGGAFTTGLPIYTFGFFMEPLTQEFGWSRTQTGAWITYYMVALLVCAPLGGRLVDRFGSRSVGSASLTVLSIVYLAFSLSISSIYEFYAFAVVLGAVSAATIHGTFIKPVLTWFRQRRGLAIGMTMSGHVVGVGLASYILPRMISYSDWRAGYISLAVLVLLAAIPVAAWLTDDRTLSAGKNSNTSGLRLGEALKTSVFWWLGLLFFFFSFGVGSVVVHLVAYLSTSGISSSSAGGYIIAMSSAGFAARIVGGYLLDRIFAPLVAGAICIAAAVGIFVLWGGGPVSFWLAVILIGAAMGAEVDLMSYLTAAQFGRRHYGSIFSLMYAMFGLGTAIGPAALGWLYDRTGSYELPLIISASSLVIAGILSAVVSRFRYHNDEPAAAF